jgi:hypothetical protein
MTDDRHGDGPDRIRIGDDHFSATLALLAIVVVAFWLELKERWGERE